MKKYLMIIFLISNPLLMCAQEQQEPLSEMGTNFDKDLNFDELEQEMIKLDIMETIKPTPPHPIIIWMRIIGLPIINAYFTARRVVRMGVQKFADFFNIKLNVKVHEESAQ
jgi:hypothetical protein